MGWAWYYQGDSQRQISVFFTKDTFSIACCATTVVPQRHWAEKYDYPIQWDLIEVVAETLQQFSEKSQPNWATYWLKVQFRIKVLISEPSWAHCLGQCAPWLRAGLSPRPRPSVTAALPLVYANCYCTTQFILDSIRHQFVPIATVLHSTYQIVLDTRLCQLDGRPLGRPCTGDRARQEGRQQDSI